MYSKIIVLRFQKEIIDKPIVSNLVRKYNLSFNILKATVYPRRQGVMVLELSGRREDYEQGIKYLKNLNVQVTHVAQDITRDEEKCYQCGACTAICPTGALYIIRPSMEVKFDSEKCSGCELCVRVCPPHAMNASIDNDFIANFET